MHHHVIILYTKSNWIYINVIISLLLNVTHIVSQMKQSKVALIRIRRYQHCLQLSSINIVWMHSLINKHFECSWQCPFKHESLGRHTFFETSKPFLSLEVYSKTVYSSFYDCNLVPGYCYLTSSCQNCCLNVTSIFKDFKLQYFGQYSL